jgi:DNA-binding Lrp family transcriptional regulator
MKKALEKMSKYKQIEKISVIAGQYDIIIRVSIENLEELLKLTNNIQMINGVEKTTTQIIEKEIIL